MPPQQTPKTPKPFMTTAEVARYLNFEPRTIMRFTKQKLIPFRKVNGRLRFDSDEIRRWLARLPGVAVEEAIESLRAMVPRVNRRMYEVPDDESEAVADNGSTSTERTVDNA